VDKKKKKRKKKKRGGEDFIKEVRESEGEGALQIGLEKMVGLYIWP